MRTHTTTIAALIAATTLALALTTTTASAGRFSVAEREWEIMFHPLTFNAGGTTISCPLTLLGNFTERTIAKTANGQVGVIRHVEPTNGGQPPCTGATITILNETLPWRVNYVSFGGTLPRITSIRQAIVGMAFRISTSGGIGCLAGTTALKPAFGENIVERNTSGVTALRAEENTTIPLGGSFICSIAGESSFRGTGNVTNLARTASITVTLI